MRQEKTLILSDIQEWLKHSPFAIIIDYTGLKVSEFSELRKRLHACQTDVHVVKNTFLRKALANEQLPELEADLKGQTAVVYGKSDVAAAAKVLKNVEAEFKRPSVRVAIVDKAVLNAAQVKALADLPSREALLAQLLGLLNTPATTLARLIQTPASQLAQVVRAHAEKGE